MLHTRIQACLISLPSFIGVAAALVATTAVLSAPPEITPIRVPADKVSAWFPEQSELKGMKTEALEQLLGKVQEADARRKQSSSDTPRLLKAKHEVVWNQGILEGKSTLTLDSSRSATQRIRLDPWTPAIAPNEPGAPSVVANDSGDVFLLVQPENGKNASAHLVWKHQARPSSEGRKFVLGLPRVPISELQLDLPKTLKPETSSSLFRGPFASTKEDRWTWLYDSPAQDLSLILIDSEERDLADSAVKFWAEKTSRIDIHDGSGLMTSDWSISRKTRCPSLVQFELTDGLEILGVNGSDVLDFKVADDPQGKKSLSVRLAEGATNPSELDKISISIRAMIDVPYEGPWNAPAVRPRNGILTKGSTVVSIDPNRVVGSLQPLGGRRVEAPVGDPSGTLPFVFEDHGAESVAKFEFERPRTDVIVDIRGELFVGNSVPRLESYLSWKVQRGRRLNLDVDLPRTWVADRVEFVGVAEAIAWHPEVRPGGSVRLHIGLPAGDWSETTPILKISAIATIAGGRGSLTLPRVRPVAARIVDEAWIATLEDGFSLTPVSAKGLTWIDPTLWAPFKMETKASASSRKKTGEPASTPRQSPLSWRWLTPDGEARVERQRSETSMNASISELATFTEDRLEILARISLQSRAEDSRTVYVGLNQEVEDKSAWRITDQSTGQELLAEPVDLKARSDARIPGSGTTFKIDLPSSNTNSRILNLRHESHRLDSAPLPLVVLPTTYSKRSIVVVRTSRNLQTVLTASGVRFLDTEVAYENLGRENPSLVADATPFRVMHAFDYDAKTPPIQIHSKALIPSGGNGVIEELILKSSIDPIGPIHHQFHLNIAPGEAETLEVKIPSGSELITIRRDGFDILPRRRGSTFVIPFPAKRSNAARHVSLLLEFQSLRESNSSFQKVEPLRPSFSLPCLASIWRVDVSEDWRLSRWGSALINTEPSVNKVSSLRQWSPRNWLSWKRKPAADLFVGERLNDLNKFLKSMASGEISLGALLTRWDGPARPILIDRFALAELSKDPTTRLPFDSATKDQSGDLLKNLRSLGFSLHPFGRAILVTSQAAAQDLEAESLRADFDGKLRDGLVSEILRSGSDRSDRFQTVARWIEVGNSMPKGGASVRETKFAAWSAHRRVYRFATSGWPSSGMDLEFEEVSNEQSRLLITLMFALLATAAAWRWCRRSVRRSIALVLFLAGINLDWLVSTRSSLPGLGLLAGCFFLIGIDLLDMLKIRVLKKGASDFVLRSSQKSVATTLSASSMLALFLIGSGAALTMAQSEKPDAILILYPYEGLPDPTSKPTRVVLKLSDYNRLNALATANPVEPPARTDARSVVHRLHRTVSDDVEVTSDFELVAPVDHPLEWTFPIGESRRISATLEGQSVPVTIEAGGQSGRVQIETKAGEDRKIGRVVRLVIKRLIIPKPTDSGMYSSLPINSHPRTRVEWSSDVQDWNPEITSAIRLESVDSSTNNASILGPLHRIEVRWERPKASAAPAVMGSVDANYLWDALPTGDRLRARFLFKNPGGIDRIQLVLGPGLIVRHFKIPGAVDTTLEPRGESTSWEARIDPPLVDGSTVEMEFWRMNPLSPSANPRQDISLRRSPTLEILAIEKQTATVGFRRPPDWSGRLNADAGAEPVTEEAFVRSWGMLPPDPLTLSGALKLAIKENKVAWPKLDTGPEMPKLRVQASLGLIARTGRVDLDLVANLVDPLGTSHEARLEFPVPFQIVQVNVDGLTSWSSPTNRTLLIRFDGPALAKRRLRVVGWLAVENDPLRLSSTISESLLPWPKWPGQAVEEGDMSVTASSRFQLENSPGAVMVSSDQQGLGGASGSPSRITYRVENPDRLGTLRWESEPPKVNARVRSGVTINPESATWVAKLRYDVSGGPLEAIHLKLPTPWARSATVELVGMPHQQVSESRGETTYWSIRPDRPVWGSVQVIVRSTLPFRSAEPLTFPDIGPLGRGFAETYLELSNATHRGLSIEGSSGLQAVASIISTDDEVASLEPLNPTSVNYYRVLKPGNWSLRVRRSGLSSAPDLANPAHSEMEIVIAPDGSLLGASRYRLHSFQDSFVTLELPSRTEILLASVNNKIVPVFASTENETERLLPSEGSDDLQVVVFWRSRLESPPDSKTKSIRFPVIKGIRLETVARVFGPDGSAVEDPSRTLLRSSLDQIDLELARWIEQDISRSLAGIDRSSASDTDLLIRSIDRFETKIKEIETRAVLDPDRSPSPDSGQIVQQAERLRSDLKEALTNFSLEGFYDQAPTSAGLRNAPAKTATQEASTLTRLRGIGRPLNFQGVIDPSKQKPELIWSPPKGRNETSPFADLGLGFMTVLVPGFLWIFRARLKGLI